MDPAPRLCPRPSRRAGPPPAALALLLALASACGDGGPAAPDVTVPADECQRDPDCNDQVDCTDDVCSLSVNGLRACEHVPRSDRCPDGWECLPGHPLGQGCVQKAMLWCASRVEGDACTPDDACALGPGTCQGGRCTYPRKECAPQACLVSKGCDAATGRCQYGPEPDGTSCQADDLACTDDACRDGACRVAEDRCQCTPARACPAPGDRCLQPARCVEGACLHDPVPCPAPEACRSWACDPADGTCKATPDRQGLPCDDGLACTGDDACRDGTCAGTALFCDGGPCRVGDCREPDGCAFTDRPDGDPCDDGDLCNGAGQCAGGACSPVGPAVDCDDGDPCTADACDPATGGCTHGWVARCCGNGLVEEGEACDPGPGGSLLCGGCQPGRGRLSDGVLAFALDAFPGQESAWLAVEEPGDPPALSLWAATERRALAPRGTPADADPGPGGRFHPALLALSEGRALLATYGPEGVDLRLLDGDGTVRFRASPTGAIPQGVAGDRLAAGGRDARALVAWQAMVAVEPNTYGTIRASRVTVGGATLAVDLPLDLAGDPAARDDARLGDACAGPEGTLVTLVRRQPGPRLLPGTVFLGPSGLPGAVQDLAVLEGDVRVPPRCVARPDGTFLAIWWDAARQDGQDGFRLLARVLDAQGAASGDVLEVFRSLAVPGEPADLAYPVASALRPWGATFAFLGTWLLTTAGEVPTGLVPRLLPLSDQGTPAGAPVALQPRLDLFVDRLEAASLGSGGLLVATREPAGPGAFPDPAPASLQWLASPAF